MYSWIMKQNGAIKTLAAMAHDGRLKLLRRLIQAGSDGMLAGELAKFAKIGATTASAQLLVLTNAGLVRSERKGREVTYFANYDQMRSLLTFSYGRLLRETCGDL